MGRAEEEEGNAAAASERDCSFCSLVLGFALIKCEQKRFLSSMASFICRDGSKNFIHATLFK